MANSASERLIDVKRTIRSCLITHQGTVTFRELNNDFREFEGENIPYREFNFSSLNDFLASLTDVLSIVERNGEFVIRVINTEETRHISSLVAGQKPARRSRPQTNCRNYGNVCIIILNIA